MPLPPLILGALLLAAFAINVDTSLEVTVIGSRDERGQVAALIPAHPPQASVEALDAA
jgi:hypothetical protein